MEALVQIGLTNALAATALALLAAAVAKLARRPALSHALWLLVLLKLLTPPLVVVPLEWPTTEAELEQPAAPAVQAALAEPRQPPVEAEAPARAPEPPPRQVEEPPGDAEDVLPPMPEGAGPPAPAPLPPAPVPAPDPAPAETVPTEPEESLPEAPWAALVGGVWLAGSALWFAVALVRIRRFQRLLVLAEPASPELCDEVNRLALRLGLRDRPAVGVFPGTVSPLLWAVAGTPRLLLPAALLARLDAEQRATLIAHELAHFRRRDHWVRCLEFLALGLYWWLPVAWWARRELREAEEECCDAWVVWALPDAAKAYASALVETLDFLAGARPVLPPAASGLGHLNSLRRRLTMIMRGTAPRMLTGAGFLAVTALAALLLPLWPTLAQQPPPAGGPPGQFGPPGGGGFQGAQQPGDVDKARADLKRAAEDLDRLKKDLDRLKNEYDQRAADLKRAADLLRNAEQQGGWGPPGMPGKGGSGGGGGGGFGGYNPAALEKRLAEMEKKLDAVLAELQELRWQSKKGGGMPGGPKGGGFPGGPGGGPGAPGGPGSGPGGAGGPGGGAGGPGGGAGGPGGGAPGFPGPGAPGGPAGVPGGPGGAAPPGFPGGPGNPGGGFPGAPGGDPSAPDGAPPGGPGGTFPPGN